MLYCDNEGSIQLTISDADLQAYLMYQLSSRLPNEMIADRIINYIKYLVWAETHRVQVSGGENGRTKTIL